MQAYIRTFNTGNTKKNIERKKVTGADGTALLLCATYRLPKQGLASLDFLTEQMDDLLTYYHCRYTLIVRNLNHPLEEAAYENLMAGR